MPILYAYFGKISLGYWVWARAKGASPSPLLLVHTFGEVLGQRGDLRLYLVRRKRFKCDPNHFFMQATFHN